MSMMRLLSSVIAVMLAVGGIAAEPDLTQEQKATVLSVRQNLLRVAEKCGGTNQEYQLCLVGASQTLGNCGTGNVIQSIDAVLTVVNAVQEKLNEVALKNTLWDSICVLNGLKTEIEKACLEQRRQENAKVLASTSQLQKSEEPAKTEDGEFYITFWRILPHEAAPIILSGALAVPPGFPDKNQLSKCAGPFPYVNDQQCERFWFTDSQYRSSAARDWLMAYFRQNYDRTVSQDSYLSTTLDVSVTGGAEGSASVTLKDGVEYLDYALDVKNPDALLGKLAAIYTSANKDWSWQQCAKEPTEPGTEPGAEPDSGPLPLDSGSQSAQIKDIADEITKLRGISLQAGWLVDRHGQNEPTLSLQWMPTKNRPKLNTGDETKVIYDAWTTGSGPILLPDRGITPRLCWEVRIYHDQQQGKDAKKCAGVRVYIVALYPLKTTNVYVPNGNCGIGAGWAAETNRVMVGPTFRLSDRLRFFVGGLVDLTRDNREGGDTWAAGLTIPTSWDKVLK